MPTVEPGQLRHLLRDGTPVLLRPVSPNDRDRIQDGVLHASPESRYLRFFSPMPQLSDEQLRYFTEVDQVNHVAWIALDPSVTSLPGLGIGRFIRMEDQSGVAEVAFAVVDAFRGRGLATALLAVLYLLAQAHGIQTLRAVVLPENRTVIGWLHRLGGTEKLYPDGVAELDLPVHHDLSGLPQSRTGQQFEELLKKLQKVVLPVA